MAGDLERELARAVANSEIILLLISDEYERSHNCEIHICRSVQENNHTYIS